MANTVSTWQYVVVTGPLRGLRDAFWKVLPRKNRPYILSCRLRGGNEDTLVSAAYASNSVRVTFKMYCLINVSIVFIACGGGGDVHSRQLTRF